MALNDMNSPKNKRKISPDNLPPTGEDPEKKKNKFNVYWIYGVIFLSIIAYTLLGKVNSDGVEINPVHYPEILKAGDVIQDPKAPKEKTGMVVVRNKKIVRLYLNKDKFVAR
ncbi:MAG: hypothetical protein EOO07_29110, partial [Chitinophagaceae bacterium]